jgi:RNA polymerase sigma factor (sigma-70 family)
VHAHAVTPTWLITGLPSLHIKPLDDFATFYAAQYPRLAGSLCAVCGDTDLAQEVAQESFARALTHWHRLSTYESPAGWVYRTAFNLLRRHWQKTKRDEGPLSQRVASVVNDEGRIDLTRALSTLPYRQRQAVVLRHVLDYSTDEVAEIMHVSPGAVRMTLHRAIDALREHYDIHFEPEDDFDEQ